MNRSEIANPIKMMLLETMDNESNSNVNHSDAITPEHAHKMIKIEEAINKAQISRVLNKLLM